MEIPLVGKLISDVSDQEALNFMLQEAKKAIAIKKFEMLIENAYEEIERQDEIVTDIVVHSKLYVDMLKYLKDDLDVETQMIRCRAGLMAFYVDTCVWVDSNLKEREIKCYGHKGEDFEKDYPYQAKMKKEFGIKSISY